MKGNIIWTILCCAAGILPLRAQTPMTLGECMDYAVEHSADIRIKEADMDDDRVARRDAILAAFTPSVEAGTHVYSNFGRSIDPESNTYVSTASFNNAYSVSASMTLFNGFQAVNNLRISKTALAMGKGERQLEEDRICLATMEAYCNVVYFTEMCRILEDQVETARGALELVRRQMDLGQKGYADVVQTEADLADREYQLTTSRNSLSDAYITLKDIMFWPLEDSLYINTAVVGEDSVRVLEDDGSAEEIARRAESLNPDIKIAGWKMDNARLQLRTARWQLAPSLSIYGGWSTSYYTYPGKAGYVAQPFWNQFRNNGGEYVQLTLSIPIFSRLAGHSQIERSRNEYERSQAEYDKTRRTIRAEVHRAVQDRDGARAAFLQARSSARVREEAWHLNSRKFEQGLISPLEYRTASDNYLEAKAKRLDALLKYYIKRSVVTYYGGVPYREQEF